MLTFHIKKENHTVNKELQKYTAAVTWQRFKTDGSISGTKNRRKLQVWRMLLWRGNRAGWHLNTSPNTVFDEKAENQLRSLKLLQKENTKKTKQKQKHQNQFLKEFGLGCLYVSACTRVTCVCMCTENISDQSLKTACSKNKEYCILSKTYFEQQEIETQEYYRKVWKSSHSP